MLGRLLRYARRHRRRFVLASVYSVLNKVFDLAPPLLIGMAIDAVAAGGPMGRIWGIAGLTVGIWAFESLFQYGAGVEWRNLAQLIQHELRIDAYAHVQDLEMAYFEERSTGGLMSVLNDDVNQLERFLDVGADELVQTATTVVVVGGAFFVLAPQVAWVAMLPIPFILWGSFGFTRRIGPRYADVRERVGLLNGQLANNLGGIATIKAYTAKEHEVGRIRGLSEDYRASNRRAIRLSSAFSPLIRMVVLCGFVGTLVLGARAVFAGELSGGMYAFLMFITQRLLWPLTRLGQTFDLYQRAMASTRRVLDLLDTPGSIPDGARRIGRPKGGLRLEDVRFAYRTGPEVLRGITLDIPAGSTCAIVGPTGSGKTSLVKLLLRFYDVTAGRVLLDGEDIRGLEKTSLRAAFGLVSQDVFLFHGTVFDNIAYGTFDADLERVKEAARIAEAHEFIERLPQGYDTIVGERGQKLSGGQRQRISIARAVLRDPPLLVLDEATSSVDNETEAAIQRSLERIEKGRTTILIAHRLSTVRNADRIHVLHDGVLEEHGTHGDLLERDGIYASLWRVQTGVAVAGA